LQNSFNYIFTFTSIYQIAMEMKWRVDQVITKYCV